MDKTLELAGFFAAHAVWCVSEGETLVPFLGYETADGARTMDRIQADKVEVAVAMGHEWIEKNESGANRAVLVYDGYVTLADGKTDAVVLEIRLYKPELKKLKIVVPYRHSKHRSGFAVHRPKFLSTESGLKELEAIAQSFFLGVNKHDMGAEIWNKHLDQGR